MSSRGFGKYRRANCQTNLSFEKLLKENSNCPSAARSTGTIGKWGITSFTSIRKANGLLTGDESEKLETTVNIPKPKKFFKSRNNDQQDSQPIVYTGKSDTGSTKHANERSKKSKKFFTSKNNPPPEKEVLSPNANNSKRDESKPPIVIRICRGKSQLLSDSDESESTPTPSSTPSTSTITSPRSAKDTTARVPGNIRITRSARRSMQSDPNTSPATADTPGDTFSALFTSPKKDLELSPQYIPAEKYELERKALYDSLLRPDSPKESASVSENLNPDLLLPVEPENKSDPPDKVDEGYCDILETETQRIEEECFDDNVDRSDSIVTEQTVEEQFPEPVEEVPPEIPVNDVEADLSALFSETPSKKQKVEEESSESENEEVPEPQPRRTTRSMDKSKLFPLEKHKDEIFDKILEKPQHSDPLPLAPVKLVISKKKGSIFKSRSMIADGSKKRRALYKHKWSDDKDAPKNNDENKSENVSTFDEYGFSNEPLMRITQEGSDEESEAVTSIKCMKQDKGYYTVVRNVKKAHQIQEIGEFQEFNDDVDYILDTLQDNNPISTRCLSAITLASKCMAPAFRMHVRAHGTVAKFFKALHDATKDQSLGLCTATVMFVLSQDRLNMDLDRDCLELMLNLLESDVSYQQALDDCGLSTIQLQKNKQKVRELCAEIQSQGHSKHLNLESITVGQLAMETLLSLTSKRAGEWFKEELRELGGLEHIIKTIYECCRQVSDYVVTWTDALLDKLRKIDRCMRVLENVTHNNEENQTYILKYNDGMILDTLVKLYRLCDSEVPLYPVTDITDKESTGTVIREALLVTLKVLINLTHHFSKQSMGSALIGAQPGIVEASLHLLLQVPHYIPEQKKFELGVLVLMLLINLIQENNANKKLLIDAKAPADFESAFACDKSALEALIEQFYSWEESARFAEKRTDAILDGEKEDNESVQYKSNEEFIEETVAKLLQKAGTHMEYTFLASYIVMLLGFLIMNNDEFLHIVRGFLKGHNFSIMVEMLKKFFSFMNLTASAGASSVCAIKATEKVLKYLEESDKQISNSDLSDLGQLLPQHT
uniref:WAPL domain-containing protein n=1 Tax=Photinus pyralis TaxID=7054 RepID=A0A1Y1KXN4_PHOPY